MVHPGTDEGDELVASLVDDEAANWNQREDFVGTVALKNEDRSRPKD